MIRLENITEKTETLIIDSTTAEIPDVFFRIIEKNKKDYNVKKIYIRECPRIPKWIWFFIADTFINADIVLTSEL